MRKEELQQCIDKMAIKETLARYAITVDTGDADGFAGIFTEDALWEWESVGLRYKGREELHDLAAAIARLCPGALHVMSNHVIDVEGSEAHSVCEFICFLSRPEEIYTILQGFYEDDLVKVDGTWLISHRRARVENPEIVMQGKIGEHYKQLREFLLR